jgi:Na+/proline symporter
VVITHSYGTIALLQTYTSAPFNFQRLVAAKSSAEARRAMWICAIISVPLSTFFYLIGAGHTLSYVQLSTRLSLQDRHLDTLHAAFAKPSSGQHAARRHIQICYI